MVIVFTREAKRDLDDLRRFLAPLSRKGLKSVTLALEKRLVSVSHAPLMGRLTPHPSVREVIEPHYGFVIPYCVKDDQIVVLRIYRSVREPLDYERLTPP
jgi:toxin ParE1/3/4